MRDNVRTFIEIAAATFEPGDGTPGILNLMPGPDAHPGEVRPHVEVAHGGGTRNLTLDDDKISRQSPPFHFVLNAAV